MRTAGRMGLDGALCAPVEDGRRQVRCPVTVIHGTDDRIRPIAIGERLAELTGGSLSRSQGGGHALPAREPVLINRLIREAVVAATGHRSPSRHQVKPRAARAAHSWVRAPLRPRRALFLSSPIGLGHAQRDVAIAAELAPTAARCRDRLAGTASGDQGAGASRRADPSGIGRAAQRIGALRE